MLPTKSKKPYLTKQRKEAQRLGRNALLSGVGSAALYWMLGGIPLVGTVVALGGLGLTAYQTWQWLQHRGKWGLRF